MDNPEIILTTCGRFEDDLTKRIIQDLEHEFSLPVTLNQCDPDLALHYNPVRRQYDANALLQMVSSSCSPGTFKTMGLFRVDLYIPILTYIFGQAVLNGKAGIASLYRLRNELYGLEQNRGLLIDRFSKVVLHEMGHSFGLIHCHNPVCIMRSSTYVEDIDQKEGHFCRSCREQLVQSGGLFLREING